MKTLGIGRVRTNFFAGPNFCDGHLDVWPRDHVPPPLLVITPPSTCLLAICEFNNLEAKVHVKEAEANPSAEGPPPSWTLFLMNFCGIVCGEDHIFAAGRDAADENSLCSFDSALQHLCLAFPLLVSSVSNPPHSIFPQSGLCVSQCGRVKGRKMITFLHSLVKLGVRQPVHLQTHCDDG